MQIRWGTPMAPRGTRQNNQRTNSALDKELPLKKRKFFRTYVDQSNRDSKFKRVAANKDKGARSNQASNLKTTVKNRDKGTRIQNSKESNVKPIEARKDGHSKMAKRNRSGSASASASASARDKKKKTRSVNSLLNVMPVQPFTALVDGSSKGGYPRSAEVNGKDMRGVLLYGPALDGVTRKKRDTIRKPKANPMLIVAAPSAVLPAGPVAGDRSSKYRQHSIAQPSEPKNGNFSCNCGKRSSLKFN